VGRDGTPSVVEMKMEVAVTRGSDVSNNHNNVSLLASITSACPDDHDESFIQIVKRTALLNNQLGVLRRRERECVFAEYFTM